MELSPEEKQKIYEEEKVRIEAREKIKEEKEEKDKEIRRKGCLYIILLFAGVIIVGIILEAFFGETYEEKKERLNVECYEHHFKPACYELFDLNK